MTPTISKLSDAFNYAMAHRPKVGGFPYLAEILRQAGVHFNIWHLPSCQSIYLMDTGNIVQQGAPLVDGLHEIPKFDVDLLIKAIRTDQAGHSTFLEFLMSTWQAGVIRYDVDFLKRSVSYYGIQDECYVEDYPAVSIILKS